jgi:hypothetical protein
MKTVFEQEAPRLAKEAGLRERSIPFAKLVYLLVLGWWQQPTAGPSHLSRFAGSLGLQVSKQAVECHFTEHTAAFLLAVLRRAVHVLICAHPMDVAVLHQFRAVFVEDGSTITLPAALARIWRGCGGNATKDGREAAHASRLKITVRYDLLGGQLDGPHRTRGPRSRVAQRLASPSDRDGLPVDRGSGLLVAQVAARGGTQPGLFLAAL